MANVWDRQGKDWDLESLFSRNLIDWELERIEKCLSRPQGKAVRKNEDDRLEGIDAKKGKFKVNSFYSFLGQERTVSFPLNANWNSAVPTKVGFFAWEAFWERF